MEPRNQVYSLACRFVSNPTIKIWLRNAVFRLFNTLALFRRKKQYRTAEELRRQFGDYLAKHDECVLLASLKKQLDSTSCQIIDLLLYRHRQASWSYTKAETREWRESRRYPIPYLFPCDTTLIHDIFVFHNGLKFLPHTIGHQIADGCVIDGGAASGDSALVFLEYSPVKVYAFEPSIQQIAEINETRRLNRVTEKIEVIPYGLGDKAETCLIHDQRQMVSEISTITIDSFCDDKRVSLIKYDIEGAEWAAVRGAEKIIRRDCPILLISIYHRPEDFFEIKPLIESWGLGYRFMIRNTELGNSLAGVHAMLIAYCEK